MPDFPFGTKDKLLLSDIMKFRNCFDIGKKNANRPGYQTHRADLQRAEVSRNGGKMPSPTSLKISKDCASQKNSLCIFKYSTESFRVFKNRIFLKKPVFRKVLTESFRVFKKPDFWEKPDFSENTIPENLC